VDRGGICKQGLITFTLIQGYRKQEVGPRTVLGERALRSAIRLQWSPYVEGHRLLLPGTFQRSSEECTQGGYPYVIVDVQLSLEQAL